MSKNSNNWFGSFQEEINNVKLQTDNTTHDDEKTNCNRSSELRRRPKMLEYPLLVATCLNKTAKAKLKPYIHIFRISLVLNN